MFAQGRERPAPSGMPTLRKDSTLGFGNPRFGFLSGAGDDAAPEAGDVEQGVPRPFCRLSGAFVLLVHDRGARLI
jgi:hypothetical protein